MENDIKDLSFGKQKRLFFLLLLFIIIYSKKIITSIKDFIATNLFIDECQSNTQHTSLFSNNKRPNGKCLIEIQIALLIANSDQ